MSNKLVKAFKATSQVPMKNRDGRDALCPGHVKVIAKALTVSFSIISQAG